jgi:hypothetical protein
MGDGISTRTRPGASPIRSCQARCPSTPSTGRQATSRRGRGATPVLPPWARGYGNEPARFAARARGRRVRRTLKPVSSQWTATAEPTPEWGEQRSGRGVVLSRSVQLRARHLAIKLLVSFGWSERLVKLVRCPWWSLEDIPPLYTMLRPPANFQSSQDPRQTLSPAKRRG